MGSMARIAVSLSAAAIIAMAAGLQAPDGVVPGPQARLRAAGAQRDFSTAALTAPAASRWPTNGGNLANQRWSPLAEINRTNVVQLKGLWRARLRGSGTQPQY